MTFLRLPAVVIAAALLSISVAVGHAQSRPVVRAAAIPAFESPERLPKNWSGHKVEDLRNAVRARALVLQKKEFESSVEHATRTEPIIRSGLLTREITLDSSLAFRVRPERIQSEYDADDEALSVTITVESVSDRQDQNDRDHIAVQTRFRMLRNDSYVATNSLGTKATVARRHYSISAVALTNPRSFGWEARSYYGAGLPIDDSTLSLRFKLGRANARRVKNALSVLLVGKLEEPYAFSEPNRKRYNTTIDNPVDIRRSYECLVFELREVWFYNFATGEVYARVGPNNQPIEPQK